MSVYFNKVHQEIPNSTTEKSDNKRKDISIRHTKRMSTFPVEIQSENIEMKTTGFKVDTRYT